MTNKEIQQLIKKHQLIYKAFIAIYSPALKALVHFNSKGFNHLLFKGNKKRTKKVIHERLLLTKYIQPIIKTCPEITETRIREECVASRNCQVTYFALDEMINHRKIRVIIRKIGVRGLYNFFSIMPHN